MKVEYKEIFKLKVMLDKANIPYEFYDRSFIDYKDYSLKYPHYQIIIYNPNDKDRGRLISVVEGWGTYGENQDLLEIMGCLTEKEVLGDSVKGYLTAQNVFRRIKKNYFKEDKCKSEM